MVVKYKIKYDEWLSIPPLYPILQNEFVVILGIVLNFIFYLNNLNKKVFHDFNK